MTARTPLPWHWRFSRFLVVGVAATALHYAVAAALVLAIDTPLVLASTIGFVLSAAFNYSCNARFTFRSGVADLRQVARFVLTICVGCALNAALLHQGVAWGIPAPAAQVLATVGVLFWNFGAGALWVFKPRI
jgi:putative flippase GtrA